MLQLLYAGQISPSVDEGKERSSRDLCGYCSLPRTRSEK